MEAETDAGFIQREVAKISIHSARVGGDNCSRTVKSISFRISIHSARVGGDVALRRNRRLLLHFNPLRPRGRRRSPSAQSAASAPFQSTPPVWAETGGDGNNEEV